MSESLFLAPISQEAEVAHAHKAVRQDVEQKAADKLLSVEGCGLLLIAVFAIAVAQGDLAVFDIEDTIVGERHTVSVAAEIVENGLGRPERLFRVDDPVFVVRDVDVAEYGIDLTLSTSFAQPV